MERVTVEAPASTANLGPGFDVFAAALEKPRDRITLTVSDSDGFSIDLAVKGFHVPKVPEENAAGAVVLSMAKEFGLKGKVKMRITKRVPVGVGLGSSASSSAAAALGVDALYGLRLDAPDLVAWASIGERTASGTAHLDNVSASLLGGFVIVPPSRKEAPVVFDPPGNLRFAIATPSVKLPPKKTEYARAILPNRVALSDVVHNVSRASILAAGFASGSTEMIGAGMDDVIVEAARKRLIPGYAKVRRAAVKAGAAGVCISGAGPSMLAAVDSRRWSPGRVLDAMVEAFRASRVRARGMVSRVGKGAKVIESS